MNIVVQSGMMVGDDKVKQIDQSGWVHKALEKEVGFDLERVKETFMELKKSFVEASTSRSQNKLSDTSVPTEVDPSVLTTLLETCMKLLHDKKAVKGLQEFINKCVSKDNSSDGPCVVRKIGKHKERT